MLSVGLLRLLALLLAFGLPGYGWVAWLHRPDGFGRPVRCVLAFAWSFAVFGLVGGPFLWYGGSFTGFLSVLLPVWAAYSVVGGVAYAAARRPRLPRPTPLAMPSADATPPTSQTSNRLQVGLTLLIFFGLAAAAGWLWVHGEAGGRLGVIFTAPLVLFGGYLLARRFRNACGPLLQLTAEDQEPAPWSWKAVALGLILLQAVSSAVYDRPDWDDCFYQAAMLDYQHAATLNDQEPTHREGFPMPVIQRLLCWELWGAVLAYYSGLNALVIFHSLLPGLLVLLAYAAYAALLAEYLPRRWVPLALVGLSAYHLWGISGHSTAANHFLSRPWQGKAVLLHLAVPLLVLLLTRYAAQPTARRWLSLTACVVFALAASLSAIFVGVVLIACLAPTLVRAVSGRSLRALGGAALAALPLVLCGLVIQAAIHSNDGLRARPPHLVSWLTAVILYAPQGSVEVVWLLTLPLAAALVGDWRRGAYLVAFPLVLGLTFANPFLYDLVAGKVTSYSTYYRLLWLFPVGPGLAVLLALTVRLLARLLAPAGPAGVPLALAVLGLALSLSLPGIYVWGPDNTFIGPLATPHLAENLEKMPGDLVPLARLLADDPAIRDGRILCNQQVASYLTPYSQDFRFVQTRHLYTAYLLASVGRPQEGLERFLLATVLGRDRLPASFTDADLKDLRDVFGPEALSAIFNLHSPGGLTADVRPMFGRFHVKYVLTGPGDKAPEVFAQAGYQIRLRKGGFILWELPGQAGNAARRSSETLRRVPA